MFTCLKLNKAQTPPANSFEELEDFRQLAIKKKAWLAALSSSGFWMSMTDAEEEGVWRDFYTGQEVSQEVLETEVGGLKENTEQNCGIVS